MIGCATKIRQFSTANKMKFKAIKNFKRSEEIEILGLERNYSKKIFCILASVTKKLSQAREIMFSPKVGRLSMC